MRRAALGFVFGAWLLQQFAVLPCLYWASLLVPSFFIYFFLTNYSEHKPSYYGYLKTFNIVILAGLIGFFWAASFATIRLSDELPREWQQKNIKIIGVISTLPEINDRGVRFGFDVEKVFFDNLISANKSSKNAQQDDLNAKTAQTNLQSNTHLHVPRHLSLNFYREFNRKNKDVNNPFASAINQLKLANQSNLALQPNIASQFSAGQRWQFNVRLKRPHSTYNPHGYDFEAWAISENIRATGNIHAKSGYKKLSDFVWQPAYIVEKVREKIGNKISQTLINKPYAGVIRALVVGDDSQIDPAIWAVYLNTGTNHLMSISGLHITMLAGLAFGLVSFVWRRAPSLVLRMPTRYAATFSGLIIAFLYALLAGMSVPTQRTLFMLATFALSLFLGRNLAISRALAIAVIVVVLIDPWSVIAPGFWLSFSAVALIAYVSVGRLKTQHWFLEAINTQWAITIGLLPFLITMFGQTSLVSPVANAVAIPVISLIVVPLSILGSLIPLDFILYSANWVLEFSMIGLNWLANHPLAVWQQAAPSAWAIILSGFGVLWLLLPRGFPQRWLGLILLAPLFIAQPNPLLEGEMQANVLDVGQGLSVVIKTANHTFLYDAGSRLSTQNDAGSRIILPYLRGEGIKKLDGFIVSHNDADHSGGAASVLAQMPVSWLSTSFDLSDLTIDLLRVKHQIKPSYKTVRCYAGQHWQWDGVKFEVLYPSLQSYQIESITDNNRSCVVKITSQHGSILLTGDIEKQAEKSLLETYHAESGRQTESGIKVTNYKLNAGEAVKHAVSNKQSVLKSDVLTAPHHGSKTSSTLAFIQAVDAKHAVFSVGYLNRFKHPKQSIENLHQNNSLHHKSSQNFRSDYHGAVVFEFTRANAIKAQSWRQTHPKYWHDDYTNFNNKH